MEDQRRCQRVILRGVSACRKVEGLQIGEAIKMKRLILVNTSTHRLTKQEDKDKLDEIFKPYILKKYMEIK